MRINKRGSVLLHVIVTGVLVAMIAAALLRMTMLRYQAVARGAQIVVDKRTDQAALASLIETWNQNNQVCSTPTPDFACAGTLPGTCGCSCTILAGSALRTVVGGVAYPQVQTTVTASGCQVTITSAP